jgi:hypothetical protein
MKKILFLLLLTTTLYAKEQICSWDYKLVGLFHFNEGSGTKVVNAVDKSNGVITGGAWINGLFDMGIYQSANNNSVDIADFKDLGIGGASEATFNIWVYDTDGDWCVTNGWVCDAGANRCMNTRLCDYYDPYPLTLINSFWAVDGNQSSYEGRINMYKNTWYMVTADWKANTATHIYVNAVLVASMTVAYGGTLIASIATTTLLNEYSHSSGITAICDEVGIWRRQMTLSEIREMYKKGIGKCKCIKLQ